MDKVAIISSFIILLLILFFLILDLTLKHNRDAFSFLLGYRDYVEERSKVWGGITIAVPKGSFIMLFTSLLSKLEAKELW